LVWTAGFRRRAGYGEGGSHRFIKLQERAQKACTCIEGKRLRDTVVERVKAAEGSKPRTGKATLSIVESLEESAQI
jgi:hypothetical protein